jgi:GPI mannosyltransferase 3
MAHLATGKSARVTAARGILAGAEDETAARPGVSSARRLAAGGLLCLVILGVVLRLVPIVFEPSINWGDEIFQTVEPAHRLVFGYGLVPWEFQLGMRFWLLPGVIAGLMEISRLIGDGPQYYLGVIASGLGLLACAPVVCCYLWCRRALGPAAGFVAAFAVAVAPELVYFGARTLNEVVAAHLLVVAFYLIEPGYPVSSRRRIFVAGFLLGVVCLLRINLAPAVAVLALWVARGAWHQRLPALIGGGLAAMGFGATLDWLTLGYPFASIWRNLLYNLYYGVSLEISADPTLYYLRGESGVWLTAAPFVLLLIGLGSRRFPVLLVTALTVIAVHTGIAHKEYRFVYPAILLLMVLAAVGLAQLASWAAQWLQRRGMRQGTATALSAIVLSAYWSAVAYHVWSSGTLAELRQRAHNELVAMLFVHDMPTLCGVGLYGEEAWVRYGGYSYLHRPVPMYWPKDDTELTASAAAFDTLLSDSAPPPQLGFEPVRCFGQICVAQRPGRCEVREMSRIWYPERLRSMAPATQLFEPVPERARPDAAEKPRR